MTNIPREKLAASIGAIILEEKSIVVSEGKLDFSFTTLHPDLIDGGYRFEGMSSEDILPSQHTIFQTSIKGFVAWLDVDLELKSIFLMKETGLVYEPKTGYSYVISCLLDDVLQLYFERKFGKKVKDILVQSIQKEQKEKIVGILKTAKPLSLGKDEERDPFEHTIMTFLEEIQEKHGSFWFFYVLNDNAWHNDICQMEKWRKMAQNKRFRIAVVDYLLSHSSNQHILKHDELTQLRERLSENNSIY